MSPRIVSLAFVAAWLWPLAGQAQPQDLAFTAESDGTTQRYVQVLPTKFDPAVAHDVLIALHGHGSDRWQYVRDGRDECRAARDVASRRDMIFISPDYRASTSWMGPQAEADLVQLVGLLRKQHKVRSVFLVGGSMGGASVLTFAVLHPDLVSGVSSQNGLANHVEYTQFQDAISKSFGGTKAQVPEEYRKRSAELWPERLSMPVALTTGAKDTLVPPQSVLRLAAALKKLDRRVLLIHRESGGHSTNYADTTDALEFVIRAAREQEKRPALQKKGEG